MLHKCVLPVLCYLEPLLLSGLDSCNFPHRAGGGKQKRKCCVFTVVIGGVTSPARVRLSSQKQITQFIKEGDYLL